jgi:hypothetical protein
MGFPRLEVKGEEVDGCIKYEEICQRPLLFRKCSQQASVFIRRQHLSGKQDAEE